MAQRRQQQQQQHPNSYLPAEFKTDRTLLFVCLVLPFHSEAELIGGLLDLVLGFAVQHVSGRGAPDGQDDVAGAQVGDGGLAAGGNLEGRWMMRMMRMMLGGHLRIVTSNMRSLCHKFQMREEFVEDWKSFNQTKKRNQKKRSSENTLGLLNLFLN